MDKRDIPDDLPADGAKHTFETEYAGRPPSIAIVETIAAIEGVQSTDVDFTLSESIDPDALNALFVDSDDDAETDDSIVAEFCVDGYVVQIRDNGRITVKAPEQSE